MGTDEKGFRHRLWWIFFLAAFLSMNFPFGVPALACLRAPDRPEAELPTNAGSSSQRAFQKNVEVPRNLFPGIGSNDEPHHLIHQS